MAGHLAERPGKVQAARHGEGVVGFVVLGNLVQRIDAAEQGVAAGSAQCAEVQRYVGLCAAVGRERGVESGGADQHVVGAECGIGGCTPINAYGIGGRRITGVVDGDDDGGRVVR